jgi:hypothetical protein
MRKICFTLALAFCLEAASSLAALANEMDGFRDMRWGQEIGTLKYMKFIEEIDGLKYYWRMNDEMHMSGAGLKEIAYAFRADKLAGAVLSSKGRDNARLVFEGLKLTYGAPYKQNEENYYWQFEKMSIFYHYNSYDQTLFVSYVTKDIINRTRRVKHW